MNRLLGALRVVAREEGAVEAACPEDQVPSVPESMRADIAAQILRQLSPVRAGAAASAPVAATATAATFSGDQLDARRRADAGRLKRRRVMWSLATTTLAAAAGLVLWNRAPTGPTAGSGEGGQGLPAYAVAASGGIAETRGGAQGVDDGAIAATTTAPVRLGPSSELRVTCRPQIAVSGPVAARAFLVRAGVAAEVFPEVQVANTGAVEVRVSAAQLRGAAGGRAIVAGELRVVVGRPAAVGGLTAAGVGGGPRPPGDADQRWLSVPLDLAGQ